MPPTHEKCHPSHWHATPCSPRCMAFRAKSLVVLPTFCGKLYLSFLFQIGFTSAQSHQQTCDQKWEDAFVHGKFRSTKSKSVTGGIAFLWFWVVNSSLLILWTLNELVSCRKCYFMFYVLVLCVCKHGKLPAHPFIVTLCVSLHTQTQTLCKSTCAEIDSAATCSQARSIRGRFLAERTRIPESKGQKNFHFVSLFVLCWKNEEQHSQSFVVLFLFVWKPQQKFNIVTVMVRIWTYICKINQIQTGMDASENWREW